MAFGRPSFGRLGLVGGASIPSFVPAAMRSNPPDLYANLTTNQAWKRSGNLIVTATSLITCSRASSKTNLLPTSASGFAYSTFLSNVLAGSNIEEARTNVLLNSTAPVTQTTASLSTGTYTLWVNGSGSATSSAGTATITGAGAATNGTPNVFSVTVAGTVVITVSGSLNAFQCELGAFGTSLIVTTGVTATRAADSTTLTTPLTFGSAATLFAEFNPYNFVGYTNVPILSANDTIVNNAVQLRTTTTTVGANMFAGSVNQGTASGGTFSVGSTNKLAGSFSASSMAASLNGAAPVSQSASAFASSLTSDALGGGRGTNVYSGSIGSLAYWTSQAVPSSQLQSMTV